MYVIMERYMDLFYVQIIVFLYIVLLSLTIKFFTIQPMQIYFNGVYIYH